MYKMSDVQEKIDEAILKNSDKIPQTDHYGERGI